MSLLASKNINYANMMLFEYGDEVTEIKKLGSFDKWNPSFLHPKIYTYELNRTKTNTINMLDRITFEEDLIADFKSNKTYNKLKQTLKMCNLII